MIIQIYEVRSPLEASELITMGVNRIGSVLLSESDMESSEISSTIHIVQEMGAKFSLIPLFSDHDTILKALSYLHPDIVHFCETLMNGENDKIWNAIRLQKEIRQHFPDIDIMRTIPISRPHAAIPVNSLELAKQIEPVSDIFLTDTVLGDNILTSQKDQPVQGFVGITGQTCDWETASELVSQSGIPVILAGGISPENVFDAILKVRPAGVDSCTQTNAFDSEGRPIRFKKDMARVRKLINEVNRAQSEPTLKNLNHDDSIPAN